MESMSVQNFSDFYCLIWPPGVFELSKNAKNKENQRKLKLTSSLYIIFMTFFWGQGSLKCPKMGKNKKNLKFAKKIKY